MTIRPNLEAIPPTLAEVGQVLWGASWADALAHSLKLTKEEVIALDVHPDKIPLALTDYLIVLSRLRMQQIGAMLEQLKTTAVFQGK
jgi:hypothetical protein